MKAYERLIKYAGFNTRSSEETDTTPSTPGQWALAEALEKEMKELGIEGVHVDKYCNVYGYISAEAGFECARAVGFIAHLDTATDFSGENVKIQIHENYDGKDLDIGNGKVLEASVFPHLPSLAGRTLLTTDGTTLMGADDKAGIAEIMTLAEILIKYRLPHGRVCIAFTPDEEIGGGAKDLDLADLCADFAYTVDGGPAGEIVYENFNACAADFTIHGFSIHPGDAKGRMVNAGLLAAELTAMLPPDEIPAKTEGYEGFFHLTHMQADVDKARLSYIVRDHDAEKFRDRIARLEEIARKMNEKHGEGTIELEIRQQYRNMAEVMKDHMYVVDIAKEAIRDAGLTVDTQPIRGGTDGAQLTFRGLPCPNLGTGGYAYHGPYEHITAEGMDDAVKVLLGIVKKASELE